MANPDNGVKFLEGVNDASKQSSDKFRNLADELRNRLKSDFSRIKQEAASYEQQYWNDNKDTLQKLGWSYTPDKTSAWGGKWSKQTPPTPTPVLQEKSIANQQAAVVNSQKAQTTPTSTSTSTPTLETPRLTLEDYKKSKYFRGVRGMSDDASVTIDGKKYPIFVMQNRYTGFGKAKEENDRTYAVDPETGKMRRVFENWFGIPHNAWSEDEGGEDWFYPSFMAGPEYEWLKANPQPAMRGPLGGGYTPEYEAWSKKYKEAKATGFKKQGGTMNRINYFQQGGAAPLQNMQQQVIQLVQAAMSGDEKATLMVNKIMEAAKAGDQQAALIAQMIQTVAQQMQGLQAPSAKWGSKLEYIRSLKYARGGVACQACQSGAQIPTSQDKAYLKSTKKVEEKACGGKAKKTKKRYFGGWL